MSSSDAATFERLERLSTPAVADTKHGAVRVPAPSIEPVHSECAFVGSARTVTIDPTAIWAPVQTLDRAEENEVVVVDSMAVSTRRSGVNCCPDTRPARASEE